MKNKKGQTIYSEEIYFPVEFRTRVAHWQQFPSWVTLPQGMTFTEYAEAAWKCRMPVLLTGWVQGEVHVQCGHQSLN